MKARLDPEQAIVATAHKMACTVYYLLKHRVQYPDIGAPAYEQKQRDTQLARLKRQAAKLGFTLTSHIPELPAVGG